MNRRLSLGPRAELWAGWCGVGGFSLSFMDANSRRLAVRPASSSGETGWPAASDASTISLRMAAGDSRCRETHGRAAAGRPGEAAEAGNFAPCLAFGHRINAKDLLYALSGDSLSLPFFWDGTARSAPHLCSPRTPAFLSSRRTMSKSSGGVIATGITFGASADDMESSGRSSIGESNSTASEDVLPDLGRRYHRGRSWSGQAAANREETHGFALSPARTNCFTPSDVARPDPRRRRGWIDPPPAQ